MRFWNVNGGNTRNFGGSTDFLYAVGVSPDGAVVAAGGEEGIVGVYNGTNGQLVKTLLPPGAEPATSEKEVTHRGVSKGCLADAARGF